MNESKLPKDLAAVWNHLKHGGRSHTWILRAFTRDPAKAVAALNLALEKAGDRRCICSRPLENGTRTYWVETLHWRSKQYRKRKAG